MTTLFIKEDNVRFRRSPDIVDTNIIQKVNKGQQMVQVDENPWYKVNLNGVEGWVRGDFVTLIQPVFSPPPVQPIVNSPDLPNLVAGFKYLFDNENTKKLREIIGDVFGLGACKDFLNCTEYVQYRIKMVLGITIKWPSDRPRDGGRWPAIFEKNMMYKILDEPKCHCAVSFPPTPTCSTGHIAFVEEVFPDWSVKISEANVPIGGTYSERLIKKDNWQAKKVKFIDFT